MLMGAKMEAGLQVRRVEVYIYKKKKRSKNANYCFLIHYNEIIYEKGNLVCVFDACVCYWVRAKLFCLKFFKRSSYLFWIKFVD